ncbi:uncharacterized protein LOC141649855 [Silene latifolia]|uniref:uncharacterized protein LOC141649855 n=1 Tax=Silene latifolia TaxID=37657 RepID=UPI003D7851DC
MPEQINNSDSYEYYDDPLYLSSFDQPFSQLTASLFDGSDFLSWKQDILMALAAKNKDGFINGVLVTSATTDKKYHQHIRCDLMVLKWILNSIDKPLRDNLKYIKTAKGLWDEIMERYGQSNFIEIYQLTQELNATSQSNSSLIEYYSKVKHLWETLDSLDPVPNCSWGTLAACTCTLLKRMHARDQHAKFIKFLMGLNAGYDIVQRQKQLTDAVANISDITAYASYKASDAPFTKKPDSQVACSSTNQYCSRCDMNNHSLENCFWVNKCPSCGKLGHSGDKCFLVVGFPKKNTKGKGNMPFTKGGNNTKRSSNAVDVLEDHSPIDDNNGDAAANITQSVSFDSSVIDGLVTSVVDQVLKRISDSNQGISSSNFSDHMTYNVKLLTDITKLVPPVIIGLPDGTSKTVTISGTVQLISAITLKNVLLIPDFKQNLLSVSKLIDCNSLSAVFLSQRCLFQDPLSKKCIATGKRIGDLYRFQDTVTQSLIKHIAAVVTIFIHNSSVNSNLRLCYKATQSVSLLLFRV